MHNTQLLVLDWQTAASTTEHWSQGSCLQWRRARRCSSINSRPDTLILTVSELLTGSFHSAVRIILSSLSCWPPWGEPKEKEKKELCILLLDIVLRAELYRLPPRWSYCAMQTEAWRPQLGWFTNFIMLALVLLAWPQHPCWRHFSDPFLISQQSLLCFCPPLDLGTSAQSITLGEKIPWRRKDHICSCDGNTWWKRRSRIRSKYTISSLFEGCRQS